MKKLGILVFSILLLSLSACKNGLTTKNEKNGKVSLSIGTKDRTISPVEWTLDAVEEWTIVFTGTGVEKIFTTGETTADFIVPAGTYTVTVTGNDAESSYTLCGEVGNFEVSTENDNEVFVGVTLKKTTSGKGSFEFILNLNNQTLYDNDISHENVSTNGYGAVISSSCGINAYLYPVVDDGVPIELLVRGTKNTEENYFEFTISGSNIPSGFYTLVVTKTDSDERVLPINLPDPMIEIADDLETLMPTYYDSDFNGTVYRTFYITNDSSCADNSGLSPRYKKYVPAMLEWLCENRDQWQYVYLLFTPSKLSETETDPYVIFKALAPEIDLDYNPTRYNYAESVTIINGLYDNYLTLEDNTYELNSYDENYYWFTSDAEKTLSFTLNNFYLNEKYYFLSENVNFEFNSNTAVPPTYYEVYRKNFGTTYYPEASKPFLTLNLNEGISGSNFTPENFTFKYTELRDDYSINPTYAAYPVLDSENNSIKCYTDKAGSFVMTGISTGVPEFELTGPYYIFISDGNDVPYVYEAKTLEQFDFNENTQFDWLMNGEKIPSENKSSVKISLSDNSNIQKGNNKLTLIASFGDKYLSKTIEFTCTNGAGPVYWGQNAEWASDNVTTEGDTIHSNSSYDDREDLTAFCYDQDNNLYVSVRKGGSYNPDEQVEIYKYKYNYWDGTFNPATKIAGINLTDDSNNIDKNYLVPIRMTSDGKNLYLITTNMLENYSDYYSIRNGYYYPIYKGNKILRIPIPLDDIANNYTVESSLDFIDVKDFDTVTAITCDPKRNLLYIAGEKTVETRTEYEEEYTDEFGENIYEDKTINVFANEYSVISYAIPSAGATELAANSGSKVISYTDDELFEANPDLLKIDHIGDYSINEFEHYTVKIDTSSFITDLIVSEDVVYALKNQVVKYTNSYGFDESNRYRGSSHGQYILKGFILYKKEKDALCNVIEVPQGSDRFTNPLRILAVKRKNLKFSTVGNCYEVNLDSGAIKGFSTSYGMSFDSLIYGSGHLGITTHLYKSYTASTNED